MPHDDPGGHRGAWECDTMGLQRWRCAKGHLCRWRSSLPDAGILTVTSLTGAPQPQSAGVRSLPDFQPWWALHCQLDVLSFVHVTPRSPCQAPRSAVVSWQESLKETLEGLEEFNFSSDVGHLLPRYPVDGTELECLLLSHPCPQWSSSSEHRTLCWSHGLGIQTKLFT